MKKIVMDGLETKESSRMPVQTTSSTPANQSSQPPSKMSKTCDVLADNFGNILNLANNIVEIKKMKVASDACLAKMAEDRKKIMDEAQAYAIKKRADTSSVVDRMNIIRSMMQDFYSHSQGNLSGDDFCKIITEVVNQMGRVEDGMR